MAINGGPGPDPIQLYLPNPVFYDLWNGVTSKPAGTLFLAPIWGRPPNDGGAGWDPIPGGGTGPGGRPKTGTKTTGFWFLDCPDNTLGLPSWEMESQDVDIQIWGEGWFNFDPQVTFPDEPGTIIYEIKLLKKLITRVLWKQVPCDEDMIKEKLGMLKRINNIMINQLRVALVPTPSPDVVRAALCEPRPVPPHALVTNLKVIKGLLDLKLSLKQQAKLLANSASTRSIIPELDYWLLQCTWIFIGHTKQNFGNNMFPVGAIPKPPNPPCPVIGSAPCLTAPPDFTIEIDKHGRITKIRNQEDKRFTLKNKRQALKLPGIAHTALGWGYKKTPEITLQSPSTNGDPRGDARGD